MRAGSRRARLGRDPGRAGPIPETSDASATPPPRPRPSAPHAPRPASAVLSGAVLSGAVLAWAEAVAKGPNGPSVARGDLRLRPNGTVEADKGATLVCPAKRGSFADATFGPKVPSSGGVDTGGWVDQSCGQK